MCEECNENKERLLRGYDILPSVKVNDHHPERVFWWHEKPLKGRASVKISATLSCVRMCFTRRLEVDKCNQKQWYLTAKNLERGVIQGESVVASVKAGMLSSKTVEMVNMQVPRLSLKMPSISKSKIDVRLHCLAERNVLTLHWVRVPVSQTTPAGRTWNGCCRCWK